MTPLGILAARRTNTRSNPDAKPFQELFDQEKMIRKAKKQKRSVTPQLHRNFSLPAEGVISIHDISEHFSEEFEPNFPKTKSQSSLSEATLDPSEFEFTHIS